MMAAINHMEHTFTMGTLYLNASRYPKIKLHRSNPVGERNKDEQMRHLAQSGIRPHSEERTTTKTVVKDRKLVIEKYDQNGRLIRLTPPGYIPFDHVAHSILV